MLGHDGAATLFDVGNARLRALARAVSRGDEATPMLSAFQDLTNSWARRSLSEASRYSSNVADDGAPFEFCVAFGEHSPELQAYVEPLGPRPSVPANVTEARSLLSSLEERYGLYLGRYREIEELFLPSQLNGNFGLWLGVSWLRDHPLRFKCYLNPQVRGTASTLPVLSAAMQRLGFAEAWSAVEHDLIVSGDQRDEPSILCLDLSESSSARVKVYVRHHNATVERLDRALRFARDYHPGDAQRFLSLLSGGHTHFAARPPITELAFIEPADPRPASCTLEFPVGNYVHSDWEASERVTRCLRAFGIDPEGYVRAVGAFASRPLRDGVGLHAHVTLRRIGDAPRIAIYLATEAYKVSQVYKASQAYESGSN